MVRRHRRGKPDAWPAAIAIALCSLLIRAGGLMAPILGGAAAGVMVAAVVLALGVTPAAWFAIGLAVLAIGAGAADYVRTH
ncbi:hypothetical protein AWC13_16500 [Mycobacterium kubicae]|nr:hypothetical protein AWC13_16500 [Mycobacterium kubicae]